MLDGSNRKQQGLEKLALDLERLSTV